MALVVRDYISNSCVGSQICELSTHRDALEAMTHFCNMYMGQPRVAPSAFARNQRRYNTLQAFYTFTAGDEKQDGAYGSNFARLIEDHNLGSVVTNGPRESRISHPGRNCQVWVWAPDQKNMEDWWDKANAKKIAELEAAEKAKADKYKTLITQYGITKVISVQHRNAHPNGSVQRGAQATVGGWFIVDKLMHGGSAYFTREGTPLQQYVTFNALTPATIGKKYIILEAGDPYKWLLGEVNLEELPESREVTSVKVETCTGGDHCFCIEDICCYCKMTKANAVVETKYTVDRPKPTLGEVIS